MLRERHERFIDQQDGFFAGIGTQVIRRTGQIILGVQHHIPPGSSGFAGRHAVIPQDNIPFVGIGPAAIKNLICTGIPICSPPLAETSPAHTERRSANPGVVT